MTGVGRLVGRFLSIRKQDKNEVSPQLNNFASMDKFKRVASVSHDLNEPKALTTDGMPKTAERRGARKCINRNFRNRSLR